MDRKRVISIIVIFIAVIMIAFGAFRNEVADVLNKAIRICLECIGIGWFL